jgi:hypothetical protein
LGTAIIAALKNENKKGGKTERKAAANRRLIGKGSKQRRKAI